MNTNYQYCPICGNSINHSEQNAPIVCGGKVIFNSTLTECKKMAYVNGQEIYETEKAIIGMDNGVTHISDRDSIYWLRDGATNKHVGMIITGKLGTTYIADF